MVIMCPAYERKPGILCAVISAGWFTGIPAEFWFVYDSTAGAGRGVGKTHMYAKHGKTSENSVI